MSRKIHSVELEVPAVDHDQGRPYTLRAMADRKTPIIVSGVWQIIRFVILVTSSILYLNPRVYTGISLLILLIASPSFVLSVLYFFAGSSESKFIALRGFLLFGKVAEIFPGLLLLVLQSGALYIGIAKAVFDEVLLVDRLSGYTIATEQIFHYGLAGIVLVDLIFLLVLLSYKTEPKDTESGRESTPGENLPEYTITEIEEE